MSKTLSCGHTPGDGDGPKRGCATCTEWFAQRLRFLKDQEEGEPEQWIWMSFVDPDRPAGMKFLGVIITKARGLMTAVENTYQRGINPGGEVMTVPMPDWEPEHEGITDRLLSAADLEREGLAWADNEGEEDGQGH